jgi:hypothetical protein
MKEGKTSTTKKIVQGRHKAILPIFGSTSIAMKDQPHMEEVESYWKSLWEEKVKNNEDAEWIRREEREKQKEKTNNMNWIPIGTTETTSFLSKN